MSFETSLSSSKRPPPAQIQDAIIDASVDWNLGQTTSGVRFLPKTGSEPINLVIAPTSQPGACLHIDAFNGILFYSSTFAAWAADNSEEAAAAMMHELGHYMGLADAGENPSNPTIMANPTGPCSALQFSNTSLQQSDITKAGQCSAGIIEASTDELQDIDEVWDEWTLCWHYFLIVDYYSCSTGGCVYLYSDAPIYIGSSCW